jgi:hypothetical protein
MNNFIQSRHGYAYEVPNGAHEASKRNVVKFEVKYLKGSARKGVLASLRHTTIEQHDGYHMETFSIFGDGNISTWVKVLDRKSDKEVLKAAEALDNCAPLIVSAFIESADKGRAALLQAISDYSQKEPHAD